MEVCWLTIGVITGSLVLLYQIWKKQPHPNFPPGPKGLPLVGVMPYLDKFVDRKLKKWSLEKYGSVMSARFGTQTKVVLNDYDSIKEAFVVNSPKCAGRPCVPIFEKAQGPYGLLLLDFQNNHSAQSNCCFKTLTNLGMGNEGMEDIIHEELKHLITHLSNEVEKPRDLRRDFFAASTNVLAKILFGKRYEYHDNDYNGFLSCLESTLIDPSEAKLFFVLTSIPSSHWIPPFSGAKNRFIKRFKELHEFIRKIVKEHRDNFSKDDLRDFIDHFLHEEMHGEKPTENRFHEKQLVALIRDLFGGGAETTSQELYWVLLCLLQHPNMYMEIVEEIDRVIGKEKLPSYNDRHEMPLTMAFLEEVWRVSTPITRSIEHRTLKDMQVMGYNIPKGTIVFGNQWGSNHDPKTFPDPRMFKPSRHIDMEGNFIQDSKVIVFGKGLRQCVGSKISLAEVFILITGVLQRFEISAASPLPSIYDTNKGLTNNPKSFQVSLRKRH